MLITRFIAILLLLSVPGFTNDGKQPTRPSDGCGSPPKYSSDFSFLEYATVAEIINGDTLVVILHDVDIDWDSSRVVLTPR